MTVYSGLFLKVITEECFEKKYKSHGRELVQSKLIREAIPVPKKSDGQLDWAFMDAYIKSVPYSRNLIT